MRSHKYLGQGTTADGWASRAVVESQDSGETTLAVAYTHSSLKSEASADEIKQFGRDMSSLAHRIEGQTRSTASLNDRVVQNRTRELGTLNMNRNAAEMISKFYRAYHSYGVIRSTALMLRDFTATGFRIGVDESKDKDGSDYAKYQRWLKLVGMRSVVRALTRDYWGCANSIVVPHYAQMTRVNEQIRNEVSIDNMIREAKAGAEIIRKWAQGAIPIGYEFLPPSATDIVGPIYAPTFVVTIDALTLSALNKLEPDDLKALLKYQPVLSSFKQGRNNVAIPCNEAYHLAFDKGPYERFGTPFWWQAYFHILRKDELMEADQVTARSGLQYLVTVTIGNDDYPATDQQILAVANLFLSAGQSHTIFWNHTLDVKIHQPELELFGKDKYEPLNNAVLEEMGIPVVITGGEAPGNFAVAKINIRPVIERVSVAKQEITDEFLQPELDYFRDAAKIRSKARVVWDPSHLEDSDKIANIMLNSLDRGAATVRQHVGLMNALDLTSESWEDFLAQKKIELDLMKKGILNAPGSPYNSSKDGAPNSRPTDGVSPKSTENDGERDLDGGGDAGNRSDAFFAQAVEQWRKNNGGTEPSADTVEKIRELVAAISG